jgi:heme oxygenase
LLDALLMPPLAEPQRPQVSRILAELRDATRHNHDALERRLPFMSADLDILLYRRLMQAYYGFYSPLEHRLQQVEHLDSIIGPKRYKASVLHRDLQALGLSGDQIRQLPSCEKLPVIENRPQIIGVLYVIEGATLGGQILRRNARAQLGLEEHTGAAFLDVYGKATGVMWKAYLAHLALIDAAEERAQVIQAALDVFACFEGWLDQAGVLQQ